MIYHYVPTTAKDYSVIDLDLEAVERVNALLIVLEGHKLTPRGHPHFRDDQKIIQDLSATLRDFVTRNGLDQDPSCWASLAREHPHYLLDCKIRADEAEKQRKKEEDEMRTL